VTALREEFDEIGWKGEGIIWLDQDWRTQLIFRGKGCNNAINFLRPYLINNLINFSEINK
jgi:hypothetical protein